MDSYFSGRSPLLLAFLFLAALFLATAGGATAYGGMHEGQVYPGVKVGPVEVGGLTKNEAVAKLRPWLGERTNRQLIVRGPDLLQRVSASDIGATYDAAAAVEAAYAIGRSGNLIENSLTQLGTRFSGHQVEAPGLHIDRSKLNAAVAGWAKNIDRPVREAELKVTDAPAVSMTTSIVGRKVDQNAAVALFERALGSGPDTIDLPVAETAPKVTEKDLEPTRAALAKIFSAPVSLEFEGKKWGLTPKEIAALVSLQKKAGNPTPAVTLNEEPLKKLIEKIGIEVDQPKSNARFDWNGGKPKLLRAGQDGRKLDREKALSAFTASINGENKTVRLPVEVDRAAGVNVDPSTLNLTERIEFATTSYAAGVAEKQHNIRTAAAKLNGVLLAPGEMFSFNKEIGPTTLKAGFQIGFGIAIMGNGEMQTVPSVAGGICQVASTLLHAVFNAGYQIEERYPHAYWIQSYGLPPKGMIGLDATVDDPYLDLKWVNNTSNYLLVQAKAEGGTLEFSLYGTKPNWRVEIDKPAISNVVKADETPVKQEEPTWPQGRELWVERATDGMDVVVTRRVIQGSDVRTLNLKSHYEPSRNVLMVGSAPPPATATPAPGATAGPSGTPGTASTPATAGTPPPAATPGTAPTAAPAQPTATRAPAQPGPTANAPKPTTAPAPAAPTPTPPRKQ